MFSQQLLERFDILSFLKDHTDIKRIGGRTEYIMTCPFCDKKSHCGVQPSSHKFRCFRCQVGGNIIKLIQRVSGKSYIDTLDLLKEGIDDDSLDLNYINDLIKKLKVESNIEKEIKPIQLPEGYESLHNKRIPYLDKRQIPQDQVNYYKMGVCLYGPYKNRLIVCDVNENQEPIYWIARDITGNVPSSEKVYNPNATLTGIGSGDLLFNYSLAKNYDRIVITEGVFDSLWVGNNGVAAYGKGLKFSHCYWLLKAEPSEVVLLYDADVSDEELEKDSLLLSNFFTTKICKLPSGDPDDYPKETLYKIIEDAKPFNFPRLSTLSKGLEIG